MVDGASGELTHSCSFQPVHAFQQTAAEGEEGETARLAFPVRSISRRCFVDGSFAIVSAARKSTLLFTAT